MLEPRGGGKRRVSRPPDAQGAKHRPPRRRGAPLEDEDAPEGVGHPIEVTLERPRGVVRDRPPEPVRRVGAPLRVAPLDETPREVVVVEVARVRAIDAIPRNARQPDEGVEASVAARARERRGRIVRRGAGERAPFARLEPLHQRDRGRPRGDGRRGDRVAAEEPGVEGVEPPGREARSVRERRAVEPTVEGGVAALEADGQRAPREVDVEHGMRVERAVAYVNRIRAVVGAGTRRGAGGFVGGTVLVVVHAVALFAGLPAATTADAFPYDGRQARRERVLKISSLVRAVFRIASWAHNRRRIRLPFSWDERRRPVTEQERPHGPSNHTTVAKVLVIRSFRTNVLTWIPTRILCTRGSGTKHTGANHQQ